MDFHNNSLFSHGCFCLTFFLLSFSFFLLSFHFSICFSFDKVTFVWRKKYHFKEQKKKRRKKRFCCQTEKGISLTSLLDICMPRSSNSLINNRRSKRLKHLINIHSCQRARFKKFDTQLGSQLLSFKSRDFSLFL